MAKLLEGYGGVIDAPIRPDFAGLGEINPAPASTGSELTSGTQNVDYGSRRAIRNRVSGVVNRNSKLKRQLSSVPHPNVIDLIFDADIDLTAEQIADIALNYRPTQL